MVLRTRIILLIAALIQTFLPTVSFAAPAPPQFIRDAEVEDTIRLMATPIFQAAGLNPNAITINIILDPTLNAFVAGGQNLFLHTGLLIRVTDPNQLIGVIAHETGHMAGGHLARMDDAINKSIAPAILGMVLGAAVGAATGRGDAAAAIMMGGQDIATRNFLSFSRVQESSADQAGLKFLDATHQSSRGLMEFMEVLSGQELLVTTRQDPYVRTHPLTQDRIAFIRDWTEHSKWANQPPRPEYIEPFQRMRAKLFAFIEPPVRTFQRYKESDNSIASRYARAIAAYRKPDMSVALPLIDGLIAERPKDPYFQELKGQILFENAMGADAIAPYQMAAKLKPDNALIRIELAQAELEQDDEALAADAEINLNAALAKEPDDPQAWNLLGNAYAKKNDEGMAAYAMAESALLEGRANDAVFLAGKAERLLPHKGSIWLRLQDLKDQAQSARQDANAHNH